MEYLKYLYGLFIENPEMKFNLIRLFLCAILVFWPPILLYELVVDDSDIKVSDALKYSFFDSIKIILITFTVLMWIDVAWFYKINDIIAIIVYFAIIIGILALKRKIKTKINLKKKSHTRKSVDIVTVVAPPPMGKAIMKKTENQDNE